MIPSLSLVPRWFALCFFTLFFLGAICLVPLCYRPLAAASISRCALTISRSKSIFLAFDELLLVAQRGGDGGDGGILRSPRFAVEPVGQRRGRDAADDVDVLVGKPLVLDDGPDAINHRVFVNEIVRAVQRQRALALVTVALTHGAPRR